MFEDARRQLAALEWANRQSLADWDDPEDVALYRSELRIQKRTAIINEKAPDGCCPVCKQKTHIRSWVIKRGGSEVVCRSCFHAGMTPERVDINSIFAEPQVRYRLDYRAFTQSRKSLGISGRKFARLAGWSQSYQSKLESGSIETVSEDTADTIVTVIREVQMSSEGGHS